jgi:4'-phosphopantetheinyl transferase EntD
VEILGNTAALREALIPAESGAPVWPDGVIGSISHKQNIAIALVATSAISPHLSSIGVDIEHAVASEYDLGSRILTLDEQNTLRCNELSESGLEERLEIKLRFSIKVRRLHYFTKQTCLMQS